MSSFNPNLMNLLIYLQIRYVQKNTRRNIYTEIWSELSEVYLFFSLFSGVFGSKQIVPFWIKNGDNREEAMMIFAQKVLWLLDYDEHGEASLDGVRVSTQPVCNHPFILFTWSKHSTREREREFITLFWQYLSLLLPRFLICKLGLATGKKFLSDSVVLIDGTCLPHLLLRTSGDHFF